MLNKVWDSKETVLDYKNGSLKSGIFPKGLTHAFTQKIDFFSLFVFGQRRTRNKVYWCSR